MKIGQKQNFPEKYKKKIFFVLFRSVQSCLPRSISLAKSGIVHFVHRAGKGWEERGKGEKDNVSIRLSPSHVGLHKNRMNGWHPDRMVSLHPLITFQSASVH